MTATRWRRPHENESVSNEVSVLCPPQSTLYRERRQKMRSQKSNLFGATVVVVMLGATHDVVVAQDNRPRTRPASGMFTGSPVNARQRICQGQDGPYLE